MPWAFSHLKISEASFAVPASISAICAIGTAAASAPPAWASSMDEPNTAMAAAGVHPPEAPEGCVDVKGATWARVVSSARWVVLMVCNGWLPSTVARLAMRPRDGRLRKGVRFTACNIELDGPTMGPY